MVGCTVNKRRRIVDVCIMIGWRCPARIVDVCIIIGRTLKARMRSTLQDEATLRFTEFACEFIVTIDAIVSPAMPYHTRHAFLRRKTSAGATGKSCACSPARLKKPSDGKRRRSSTVSPGAPAAGAGRSADDVAETLMVALLPSTRRKEPTAPPVASTEKRGTRAVPGAGNDRSVFSPEELRACATKQHNIDHVASIACLCECARVRVRYCGWGTVGGRF
jgi:hypothetical protein